MKCRTYVVILPYPRPLVVRHGRIPPTTPPASLRRGRLIPFPTTPLTARARTLFLRLRGRGCLLVRRRLQGRCNRRELAEVWWAARMRGGARFAGHNVGRLVREHAMRGRGELTGVPGGHKCALGKVRERLRRGRVFHVSLSATHC